MLRPLIGVWWCVAGNVSRAEETEDKGGGKVTSGIRSVHLIRSDTVKSADPSLSPPPLSLCHSPSLPLPLSLPPPFHQRLLSSTFTISELRAARCCLLPLISPSAYESAISIFSSLWRWWAEAARVSQCLSPIKSLSWDVSGAEALI